MPNSQEIRPKKVWRKVDGVLLLDKPLGLSSNDALQKARRLFSAAKGGHTGTLDPLATGLLPLCFGEATKFSADLLDADKTYEAEIRLGVTTDSGDAEGQIIATAPAAVTAADVARVLPAFMGDILQVPPMHSALKRDGKPLYEYARAGVEVERKARRVRIHAIDLVDSDQLAMDHRFSFSVHCSKGTYVRTLAADIGERLGCGAHLAALRRTSIGALGLDRARTLEELDELDAEAMDRLLLPVDFLLGDIEKVELDAGRAARLSNGQAVERKGEGGRRIRAYDAGGRFLGLCLQVGDDTLKPVRLMACSQGSGT